MPRGSSTSLRQLHVTVGSVQLGKERFPNGDTPVAANGRNNLTAISAELGLYFVAELDNILIFKPRFPTQELGELQYKWRLHTSGPNLRGYIDRQNPHAINSMLIAKLGTQEVLICACDDGDVILYYTSTFRDISIAKDFKFDADRHSTTRPFLIENVRRSAWGLAIHTNARKLAVSCNTHEVTVFAFGLTDDAILYNDPQKEWQYPGRGKDDTIDFRSHRTNIPNVSFFNSDLDKEGRYLVSTDLDGVIVLWDLRERCELKRIEPSPSAAHPRPYSGWSVACVDPRAFLLVTRDLEFLGCKLDQNKNGTYDITHGRSTLRDSSIQYPEALPGTQQQFERIRTDIERLNADMEIVDIVVDQAAGDGVAIIGQFQRRGIGMLQRLSDLAILRLASRINDSNEEENNEDEDTNDERDNEMEDMDLDGNDQNIDPVANPITGSILEDSRGAPVDRQLPETPAGGSTQIRSTESMDASLLLDTDTDSSISGIHEMEYDGSRFIPTSEDTLRDFIGVGYLNSTNTINTSTQVSPATAMPIPDDPLNAPFLLIHTGQDFVSLRKAPFETLAIISRDPCHQHLPSNMGWLLHHDRLHLSQLIPELNVFVTATAAGRAAIYTLTRKITSTISAIHDEYGMRLDFVVPFTSQEARKERPTAFLIGLVAAPLQNCYGITTFGQRWRLTLTYHDHTIMNYELWRDGASSSISTFI